MSRTCIVPKDDATRDSENSRCTIQVRQNTLAVDVSRARTLHRIAVKLSGVYTSLDKCIDREWRQEEASKKELNETRGKEREHTHTQRKRDSNVNEESFRTHVNRFVLCLWWFKSSTRVVSPPDSFVFSR